MIEPFMLNAFMMGALFSVLAGPLGSVMVWRRLAFFGDTLAHSTLLGIGVSLIFQASSSFVFIAFCVGLSCVISLIPQRSKLSVDSVLAILSHGSLALGIVVLALLKQPAMSLSGFLFGDILSLTTDDLLHAALVSGVVLGVTILFWRPLLTTLISEDLANSEGIPVRFVKIGFSLALGLTIGVLLKSVGALLMTALLIIPATAARPLAQSPAGMMVIASVIGMMSFAGGLWGSYVWDTPTGPSIVVAALGLFVFITVFQGLKNLRFSC